MLWHMGPRQSLSEVVGTHVVSACKWIITVFYTQYRSPPPTPPQSMLFKPKHIKPVEKWDTTLNRRRECSFFIPGVGTDENELGKPFFEDLECVYSKWGHLEHTNQLHCRTKIEKINKRRIYIYDWLICGHVTSDRCNVCRRATNENVLPVPTGYARK